MFNFNPKPQAHQMKVLTIIITLETLTHRRQKLELDTI